MRRLPQAVWQFLKRDDGPTALEYAFMEFLIVTVCFLAIVALGQNTNSLYQNSTTKITNGP
jgi:pilus assembly protein Flp/PilA